MLQSKQQTATAIETKEQLTSLWAALFLLSQIQLLLLHPPHLLPQSRPHIFPRSAQYLQLSLISLLLIYHQLTLIENRLKIFSLQFVNYVAKLNLTWKMRDDICTKSGIELGRANGTFGVGIRRQLSNRWRIRKIATKIWWIILKTVLKDMIE